MRKTGAQKEWDNVFAFAKNPENHTDDGLFALCKLWVAFCIRNGVDAGTRAYADYRRKIWDTIKDCDVEMKIVFAG